MGSSFIRSAILAPLTRAGDAALRVLYPPLCLKCAAPVGDPGGLCGPCWSGLSFIAEPVCDSCGTPLAHPGLGPMRCLACSARAPRFSRARAVLRYDEASRPLILAFKHGDRLEAAKAFGPWLLRAGAPLLAEVDAVVPVPLHWWRLFRRRFNQAAILAREVARARDLAFLPQALVRRRATPSQGEMRSRAARLRNVAGAFGPGPEAERLAGQRVLLVDDVMTTGATIEAAARVLLRSGARDVSVLTLARVVREGSAP